MERLKFISSLKKTQQYVVNSEDNKAIDELPLLLQNYLEQACTVVKNNRQDNKNEMFNSILSEDRTDSEESHEAINAYVNFLLNEIDNFACDLKGKSSGKRYSPEIMRLSLALWSRSGKRGYDDFRQSSFMTIPSSRRLQDIISSIKLEEGFDPKVYEYIKDTSCNHDTKRVGRLVFDEMKLKAGCTWNTSDGKLSGFIYDSEKSFNLRAQLRNMIERGNTCPTNIESPHNENNEMHVNKNGPSRQSEDDGTKHIATYVQMYRLCLLNGKAYNLQYFFNNGTLTGNEILGQLINIITMLSTIDIDIYGLTSDAGGSNARLFALLRCGIKLGDDGWLGEDVVTFDHPCSPHKVAMWYCSVHNFKNVRNALYSSRVLDSQTVEKTGHKRKFEAVDGISFGWETLDNAFGR
jgi:hypothetical protein